MSITNKYLTRSQSLIVECPSCHESSRDLSPIVNDHILAKCAKIAGLVYKLNGVQLPIQEILRMALVVGLEGLLEGYAKKPKTKKKQARK